MALWFPCDVTCPGTGARDSTAVRSRWFVLVVLVLAPLVAGCTGDEGTEPTLTSTDFTPRLVVSIDAQGFEVRRGDTDDPAITADPPSAPSGTVIEISNEGERENRVSNDGTVDTGVLQPGDSTVVVLTTEGDLELHDQAGHEVTITVTPRAT